MKARTTRSKRNLNLIKCSPRREKTSQLCSTSEHGGAGKTFLFSFKVHDKRFSSVCRLVFPLPTRPGSEQKYNKIQNMKHSNTILKRVVKQIASGFYSFHLKHAPSSDAVSDGELRNRAWGMKYLLGENRRRPS
jgi:hypothetical protein